MSFSEQDITELRRLREAVGVLDFCFDDPYQSEAEALLDNLLNLGLPIAQVNALWAAGVKDRRAYRDAANRLQSSGGTIRAGRKLDPARLYFMEHILHHIDLLHVSRGPGGRSGGNAAAQLNELDAFLNKGIYTLFGGVIVERIVRGPREERRYQFIKEGYSTKTYSRDDLLNGVIQRAFDDIEKWLELARNIKLPSDK